MGITVLNCLLLSELYSIFTFASLLIHSLRGYITVILSLQKNINEISKSS